MDVWQANLALSNVWITVGAMSKTDTSRQAYREILENGTDVSLRKQVCAYLAAEPSTTHELSQAFPDRSQNALRPRVDELLRMGCIIREGKRENPSGHEAYVHHVTETGHDYLKGKIDPKPKPPLSELQGRVVDIARLVCKVQASRQSLIEAVQAHDTAKHRRNPEWTSEFVDETQHMSETENTNETDGTEELTDEQIEKIENDPFLELSDFQ